MATPDCKCRTTAGIVHCAATSVKVEVHDNKNFAHKIEKYVKFNRPKGFFILRISKTLKNHISEKKSNIKNAYGKKCRKCSQLNIHLKTN